MSKQSAAASSSKPAAASSLVLPGQPLTLPARSPLPRPGPGTYRRGPSHILSSLVGSQQPISSNGGSGAVSVLGPDTRFVVPAVGSTVLGRITRVTPRQATVSILIVDGVPVGSARGAAVHAAQAPSFGAGNHNHAAGESDTGDFTGVIRKQDVRATEKDKTKLADCFRPGDIVRAFVISLGDARSYVLSTGANHLGVIYATSSHASTSLPSCPLSSRPQEEASETSTTDDTRDVSVLEPVNWQEMRDLRTGLIEKRKVAKPEWV